MKRDICFVIVTYYPDEDTLRPLKAAIRGWPLIVVDNSERNIGYGAAANRGMREAFGKGAAWVVVLNQDVELNRTGLARFCVTVRTCKPGIVGPEAGSLEPKRWTTILPARGNIDYISGSMMAIHREVWDKAGGFYEPYFMYYEDADLCVRARNAGFPIRQTPTEGFRHESRRSDEAKEWYLARNHLWFVLRLAPWRVKLREFIRLPKTAWEYIYDYRR